MPDFDKENDTVLLRAVVMVITNEKCVRRHKIFYDYDEWKGALTDVNTPVVEGVPQIQEIRIATSTPFP